MITRRTLFKHAFVAAGYFATRKALAKVEEEPEPRPLRCETLDSWKREITWSEVVDSGTVELYDADGKLLAIAPVGGDGFAEATGIVDYINVKADDGEWIASFPADVVDWNTRQLWASDTIDVSGIRFQVSE